MPRRVKIGDIVEVKTAKGLGYAQFTHKHPEYGELIRVLRGLHAERPTDWKQLVSGREAFVTFVPLQAAVSAGLLEVAGRAEVPESARPFPLFRVTDYAHLGGTVEDLWLWDGHKKWREAQRSPDHLRLPVRGVWSVPLLIERVAEGWTPEDGRVAATQPIIGERGVEEFESAGYTTHFLGFRDRGTAQKAVTLLRDEGYAVSIRRLPGESEWQVTVARAPDAGGDVEEVENRLEDLVAGLGGPYQGHEIEV